MKRTTLLVAVGVSVLLRPRWLRHYGHIRGGQLAFDPLACGPSPKGESATPVFATPLREER